MRLSNQVKYTYACVRTVSEVVYSWFASPQPETERSSERFISHLSTWTLIPVSVQPRHRLAWYEKTCFSTLYVLRVFRPFLIRTRIKPVWMEYAYVHFNGCPDLFHWPLSRDIMVILCLFSSRSDQLETVPLKLRVTGRGWIFPCLSNATTRTACSLHLLQPHLPPTPPI